MPFVVTAGQVQAVERAEAPWAGSGPLPSYLALSPTMSMTYEALWRAQPALRTVIGFLARNVAQLGLDPYERISATDRRKLGPADHPLAAVLEQPLLGTKLTKYRLISRLVADLCLFDSAYWLKVRGDAGVRGVVPLPHRLIRPIGANPLAPENYRIQGNRGYRDIGPDDVVHFHGYDPDDLRDGVPPAETLRQVLAEEYAAAEYREQLWRNGARTAGYISRAADAPKWSDGARERFKSEWRAAYSGDGPDAGGTPLLEDGMAFHPSGVTPKDAQYVESRKLTREECAVAYHVQPMLMGLMEGASFSSASEIHRWLYQDTVGPYLTQISQDIECQLLPDLTPAGTDPARVYVEFNLNEKLRGSFEQQAAAISSSVGGPWMTRDEARAMYNLGHIDGADELIVPLNVVTGGLASPRDTAPNSPDNGPSNGQPPGPKAARVKAARLRKPPSAPMVETFARFFERQGRVITARAGAAKAKADEGGDGEDDYFDSERWDAELAADLKPTAKRTAAKAGRRALAALGLDPDMYDEDRTDGWMDAYSGGMATAVNTVTRRDLISALAAADAIAAARELFARYADSRAQLLGDTETTHLAGWGGTEAFDQAKVSGTKTWVTGLNPRPSHAEMDGETVGHDELFSNGARWPGDASLDDDERAGCNCDIDWGTE